MEGLVSLQVLHSTAILHFVKYTYFSHYFHWLISYALLPSAQLFETKYIFLASQDALEVMYVSEWLSQQIETLLMWLW